MVVVMSDTDASISILEFELGVGPILWMPRYCWYLIQLISLLGQDGEFVTGVQ